ncbi:protein-disulfide reductase DsbD family protein [Methylotenera versatilis]|uniref:protein-disulfide reductase DsbD family protein n=1 Tax=Methylotenera versatilis TaxID=1055487 RepID=UPI00064773B6|nr:thioredoxin family protein [Methylotenera versatilis]
MQKTAYRNLLSTLFLAVLCYVPVAWSASHQASTPQVQAELVSSTKQVVAGEIVNLGISLKIIPHWHTYWQNPGDSGTVTTIDWQFSQPSQVSEIFWPIPSRFRLGPIVNYGYENVVTLPVKVKVSPDAKVGESFKATAIVDWLVCKEECIPQQVTLTLDLPVVSAANITKDVHGNTLIEESLAKQPQEIPFEDNLKQVNLEKTNDGMVLHIPDSSLTSEQIQDVWFYPYEWGKIAQSIEQTKTVNADGITLALKHGDAPLSPHESLEGVLVVKEKRGDEVTERGYLIHPKLVIPQSLSGNATSDTKSVNQGSDLGFATALLLALIGGVILNLMPCVFPVLSIKALSLVSHAQHSQREILWQGIVYTLGVLASFAFLAGLLIALKAGGAQIGWGFQFQSPLFVVAVAYLMFAVGLSLSGVFTIGGSVTGLGSNLADKPGYAGSFFTGVLATIVATPCTAPFMAAALGYALTQPALKLIFIFLSLGFGLALPYLLLTAWPALHRKLPRPGLWMERTKQVFAFPMYLAAVWLVWVLAQQSGVNGVAIALGGMVLIAFAAWIYDSTRYVSFKAQIAANAGVTILLLSTLLISYTYLDDVAVVDTKSTVKSDVNNHWEAYSSQRLEQLLAEGKPVFLNFTAAWCISCLVNERVALSQPEVVAEFEKNNVTYLKGDWTNKDTQITNVLTTFGRSGVPLYVFYPTGKGAKPVELPQILTPSIVLDAIQSSL